MTHSDVPALLNRADAMSAAADRIRPTPGEDPAPYLLLRALATELVLKALLASVKGRYPRLHSLRALYGDLPEEERRRLYRLHRAMWAGHHPGGDPREADTVLDAIANDAGDAFHTARYPLSAEASGVPDPEPLRRVVRARLLERTG